MVETVQILDGRLGKRSVEQVRYVTRNVLLSAQMGDRASVVLICITHTSRYNEVK